MCLCKNAGAVGHWSYQNKVHIQIVVVSVTTQNRSQSGIAGTGSQNPAF